MYPEKTTAPDPRGVMVERDEPMMADAPQSEIPHALSRLEQANSHLHECVKVLHERLSSVRNEHNAQSEGDRAVRGYGSEVARRIGTECDRTEMAAEVIVKILNELEV